MATVFMFSTDRGIKANHAVTISPKDLVDRLLSVELLSKYYKNPDALLANANYLVEDFWDNYYGAFQPFEWHYDWSSDYQKLTNNCLDGLSFNTYYKNVPPGIDIVTNDSGMETKTGLELALLNKWCNQRVYQSLIDGSYQWFYPVSDGWQLGQDFEPESAKQAIGKMDDGYIVAVQDQIDFGNAMARLVLPHLFLAFHCLEYGMQGIWPKRLSARKCTNPRCEDVYFKHYRNNDNALWCSRRCGSALRMRKYRDRKQGRMVVNA